MGIVPMNGGDVFGVCRILLIWFRKTRSGTSCGSDPSTWEVDQEDQGSKVILCYILSLRPAWIYETLS